MNNWQECTWIEAANAFAAGTHEAASRIERGGDYEWTVNFSPDPLRTYQIRKKQRTITVTIPRPDDCQSKPAGFGWHEMTLLQYKTTELSQEAYKAIRAAMSEQP